MISGVEHAIRCEDFFDFLKNELPALLEGIHLREREELIFQHDGALRIFRSGYVTY